jgi:NAD(P)H-hydrate epimerase
MAWPHRDPDSHKGSHGHLLIVAGSVGMSGAAILSTRAALRSGVGLVTLAVPAPIRAECAAAVPEAMVRPVAATSAGSLAPEGVGPLLADQLRFDALAIGPGMSLQTDTQSAIRDLLRGWNRPAVIDADAINAFAAGGVRGLVHNRHGVATVLTPHPGELARLTGSTAAEIQADRRNAMDQFFAAAEDRGLVLVLKGAQTLIATRTRIITNSTGNAGLARGGTGDVLTGLIGGLAASIAPAEASLLAITATAVAWHGAAGDHAARHFSQTCMIAGDVIAALAPTLPMGIAD